MPVTLTINVAGRPKRDIIEMAFEFCGSAGYEFGRTPEEIASALRELDAMMAEEPWDQLGYDPAIYGSGRPEDPSGLANSSISAVSKYLGLRIAPGMGATLSPAANAALTRSYNLLFASIATIPTQPLAPNTVRGSGARTPFRLPFITEDAVT
jgi:hypothetical protein